jgi:hypothetical protein
VAWNANHPEGGNATGEAPPLHVLDVPPRRRDLSPRQDLPTRRGQSPLSVTATISTKAHAAMDWCPGHVAPLPNFFDVVINLLAWSADAIEASAGSVDDL